MGALGWQISESEGLVVVQGVGVFDLEFVTSFRNAMLAQGMFGYARLFDLSRADIRLSNKDLAILVESTSAASAMAAGPIAIFLGTTPPPLLMDMAVLMQQRIGSRRRMRLFTDEALARQWLSAELGLRLIR
jgi:hypothetical protein